MQSLLPTVFGLGLAIAVCSPVSVVTVIVLLTMPAGRRRGIAFVLGWLLAVGVIAAVVVVRVTTGSAPQARPFTLNMFTVPDGIGPSTLFLGIVFGFLSFAGFEAAASLGEETADPKRAIPRAIFGVALFGGVFYTVGAAVSMLGFGTTSSGVHAFSSSLVDNTKSACTEADFAIGGSATVDANVPAGNGQGAWTGLTGIITAAVLGSSRSFRRFIFR